MAGAACEHLFFAGLLKANPAEEGGRRFLYIETSNEARDLQGEVVLQKALADSADYYLRFGNLDLEHRTVTGPVQGAAPDYALWEIGKPVRVESGRGRTFVKAELYQGNTPVAASANMVWDSVTKLRPPQRWYPSIGGAVLKGGRSVERGADGRPHVVVSRVRWSNIGLSKTPVNPAVPTVSTVPLGALAKCWSAHRGLDLTKALEMSSGQSTDAAERTGGAALARQSLDRDLQSYFGWRNRIAGRVLDKSLALDPRAIARAGEEMGLDPDTAAEWAERFHRAATAAAKPRPGAPAAATPD